MGMYTGRIPNILRGVHARISRPAVMDRSDRPPGTLGHRSIHSFEATYLNRRYTIAYVYKTEQRSRRDGWQNFLNDVKGYQVVTTRLCDEDGSLLERVQQGDEQAIASLYDRHSGVVYSIAFRVLHDPVLAEQILSDIFLEIWRSPKRLAQQTANLSLFPAINCPQSSMRDATT
jgi:hypothetical protein